MSDTIVRPTSLTDEDIYLFNEGSHFRLYQVLGGHPTEEGTRFAVWAPNAESVSVIGDFNGWDPRTHQLSPHASSGIWEGFIPEARPGAVYKYRVVGRGGLYRGDKADPLAVHAENPPRTGSIIWDIAYEWGDEDWMRERWRQNAPAAPWSIYELHVGSWMRIPEDHNRWLSYRELAPKLAAHIERLGFTHVELLPIMEHPFYGSWGYQTTGYFAPSSRFGTPQDLMFLIDYLHQRGIGVLLDWVPSHFPSDPHGLGYFDGTHLYEHEDPRRGFHPDWNSYIFNYGRHEVRSFLFSSAMSWLDRYHIDGLRVDAVASMLYLDYSRREGEWIPNPFGGRENLDAIDFLRRLNVEVYAAHPDVQMIAEESTSWPMVSRPTYVGGLGFGMKWDMGWMHDTLQYFERDPVHRRFHHENLTFRSLYAFTENFVLPLSHDEVVHGKGSLLGRMPGDNWQKFANLRLLYGWMFGQPGKKLLFMGSEFGQWREWDHDRSLDWHYSGEPMHAGVGRWLGDLNRLYREEPAMHQHDFDSAGFSWVDANDSDQSVASFLRSAGDRHVLCAFNFTPVPREAYRLGVPCAGRWVEALNSDAEVYGGSGWGNMGGVNAEAEPWHGRPYSVTVSLPPLGAVFFTAVEPARPAEPAKLAKPANSARPRAARMANRGPDSPA
jgi:1,4-alpha-glucan branching enzyme